MFKSISDPLVRIAEALQIFMAEPELRLVHVTTSDAIRIPALQHIAAAEFNQDNLCPFVVLEAPVEAEDDGWAIRAEELREDTAELAELHAKANEGVEVRPMPNEARAPNALGRFGLELRAALDCLGKPLAGLVVVLSPVWVRDAKRWLDDVSALLARPDFEDVRWVIVDLDEPIAKPVAEKLGAAAVVVDARVRTEDAQREIDAMLAGSESAPVGAEPMRILGMAGPDEAPARRPKLRRPGLTGEEATISAKENGVPEAMLGIGPMVGLRGLVLGAAVAMSKGEPSRAVAMMRDARRFCRENGLARLTPMMGLMMGGYAMQARAPQTAAGVFREAHADAEAAKMPDLAAQAQMAIGAGLLATHRKGEAALAFAEAGKIAANAGARVMAIDAYRTAGEILAEEQDYEHAAGAFWRAVQIASDGEPQEWRLSSAPEAARALGKVFREHGNDERAVWMERIAVEMETLGESEADTVFEEEEHHAGCNAV